jgi:hypothetical protein
VYGPNGTILGPEAKRMKRDFDYQIELESIRFERVETVVSLFAAKTSLFQEKLFEEQVITRKMLEETLTNQEKILANQQLLLQDSVKNCSDSYREFFVYDLYLFARDMMLNETNMTIKFSTWIYGQVPGASAVAPLVSIVTILLKFSEDRLASFVAKTKNVTMKGWQKVNDACLLKLNNLNHVFSIKWLCVH